MTLWDTGKFAEGMAGRFPAYYFCFAEVGGQLSVENKKGCVVYIFYGVGLRWSQEVHLMHETDKLSKSANAEDLGDISCGFEVLPYHEVM